MKNKENDSVTRMKVGFGFLGNLFPQPKKKETPTKTTVPVSTKPSPAPSATGSMAGKQMKFTKKDIKRIKAEDYDKNVSSAYSMCDAKIPIIGSVCDRITTSRGILKWIEIAIAIPLLGFVLFVDLFGEWLTIVSQFFAEAFDGVPVAGTIFGIIEAGEFDDIIDFISMAIVFWFCGPVTIAGVPEYAEGFLEIFPFWTSIIIIWLLFIRPARSRYLATKRRDDAALNALTKG